ncbi:helix-turn-helix domain-containing protein [Xanthobacter variabilis]|uniref:helix-turn-helix domain-containing protein n=1 Tax=Xanthobacter variabilis TaxID=3119932 RepID=UPI0037287841
MSTTDRPLKTTKQIAHALGVSERTVGRMVQKGVLPARKGGCGGRTSPLILDRQAVENLKLSRKA